MLVTTNIILAFVQGPTIMDSIRLIDGDYDAETQRITANRWPAEGIS